MSRSMRHRAVLVLLATSLCGCSHLPLWVLRRPPQRGEAFPDVALPGVTRSEDAAYLGVAPAADSFRLSEIAADFLVLEAFDMYCRFCQEAAPKAVDLHQQVTAAGLGERIKILGVAIGNSQFEADLFRRKYRLPFPVIPYANAPARETLGNVGRPTFFVIRLHDGSLEVVNVSEGPLRPDARAFLRQRLRRMGLASSLP